MAVVQVTTALTPIATALFTDGRPTSVLVQAEGTVYVSKSAALTADAAATGGVILTAGQAYEDVLDAERPKLYARTASGNVNVRTETGAVA